ncbi:hypothetical protein [Acinetobacter sp. CS-2]|uniref:hypothetical protein n=1 Tax=Acinetobacter sp. CS-2 TaxID=2798861 RepID=UPI0019076F07|nr:hypothetical protein [Acinetobacter sp. CS-2]QQN40398.1 hypothetical protein JFY49_05685 [Acinetobacter sp. CS-2]
MKILIGIDTGVNTGFAVAIDSGNGGDLQKVECLSITQAMANINDLVTEHGKENIKLYIEDARLRTWFTGGREKAQGVGSVKRDAQIWESWCKEQDLNYIMIHPKANATKTKADVFKKRTGWSGRTNEHARDAAMLVFRRFYKPSIEKSELF